MLSIVLIALMFVNAVLQGFLASKAEDGTAKALCIASTILWFMAGVCKTLAFLFES